MSRRFPIAMPSLISLMLAASVAAAPPKPARPTMPLLAGAEATVIVVGDEVRLLPALGKATVATSDSLVLVTSYQENPSAGIARSLEAEADQEFGRAIRASDPDGIRAMLAKGSALRVKTGTRVRVIQVAFVNRGGEMIVAGRLPIDRHGKRLVRIVDGEAAGKLVEIPTRNLRPLAESSPDQEPVAKTPPDPGKRAATRLSAARNLEKLKKTRAAVEAYRQIVKDDPDSPEASEAARRLKALAGK